MTTALFVGYVLASAHAVVVLYVVCLILFGQEPDWPMYWGLPILTSMPVSLVAVWAIRLFCKPRPALHAPFSDSTLRKAMAAAEESTKHSSSEQHLIASGRESEPRRAAWSRVADLRNFLLPLALFGIGGSLWWLLLPRAAVVAYRALT